MYGREIEGKEYTFGVSGKLIRNALVMYDRQTESYWSQILGEAVAGEMQGVKLEFLPSLMTTWEEWQRLHPDTLALDKGGRRGGRDSYAGYYQSGSIGVMGETNPDGRLYAKEFVVGVQLDDTAVAYPFSVLNEEPVVNDTVAGTDLLVLFNADSAASVVYNREVDGRPLTFTLADTPGSQIALTDAETGSEWDGLAGTAIAGPLAGTQLERLKSTTVFWFGWTDFFSETALYGIDS